MSTDFGPVIFLGIVVLVVNLFLYMSGPMKFAHVRCTGTMGVVLLDSETLPYKKLQHDGSSITFVDSENYVTYKAINLQCVVQEFVLDDDAEEE